MKVIFLILFAILGFIVESAKIRATRTRWVQYTPTIQNTAVPVSAQYSSQYYYPKIPITKNGRLIYSYVDPRGARFNMYGYGADKWASLEAYKAYLKSQNENGGQISQSGGQIEPDYTVNSISVEQSGLNGHGKTNGDQIYQSSYQTASGFALNGVSVEHSGLNGYGKANIDQIDHNGYQTGPGFAVNGISVKQSGLHEQEKNNGDQSNQNENPVWPFVVNGNYVDHSGLNVNGNVNGDQINQSEHQTWPGFAMNGVYVEQSGLNEFENAKPYQIGSQTQPSFAENGISIEQSGLTGYGKVNGGQINQNEHQIWPGFAVNGISIEQSGLNGHKKVTGDQIHQSVHQIWPDFEVNGISVEQSGLNVNRDQINQSEHQTSPASVVNSIFADQNGLNGYGGLISHSENQNLQNSAIGIPLVQQNLLNYGHGHNLDLSINRMEQNSEDIGKNIYSIHQNVQNPEQNIFSVDQNVQNGANKEQVSLFVDGNNGNAELNAFGSGIAINEESSPLYSGSNHDLTLSNIENVYSAGQNKHLGVAINGENSQLYSGSDHDITLSDIANVHSGDQSKLIGIASGASLLNNENEISIHNEQNTSTGNVSTGNYLISGDDGKISHKELKQYELQEAPGNDLKEIVIELSIVPEDDEGILKDIEDDDKVTGTENEGNVISDNNPISVADEGTYSVVVDSNKLAKNDASLQIPKDIITNPENSVPFKHATVNDLILPTPYSDIDQNHLNDVEKIYRINTMPHVYPYILQQNQINRYRMPWSAVYPIRKELRNTKPAIEPVPESISPKLVKNIVSSICLNPQVNVIPGNEEDTSAEKRLDTLLRILKFFGIHHIPRNIDNNIKTSRDIHMRYELERRPLDLNYAEGALEPVYYDLQFSHAPPETDLNPLSPFPSQHNVYVEKLYVKPKGLNILSKSLRSNPHSNNVANVESINPEFSYIPEPGLDTVDKDTSDSLQTMNYNEANNNIMMAGYNTPEQQDQLNVEKLETTPEEKFILLITEAIKPELVRFYYSQCHSEKDEKLVEGVKALIDSLQGEHCEVLTP